MFFKKEVQISDTVYYDFKSRFLVIFSSNYWHRLVLKILFADHIFLKISKYRTENIHFRFTGEYFAPLYRYLYGHLLFHDGGPYQIDWFLYGRDLAMKELN